jgi:hypothetical protein
VYTTHVLKLFIYTLLIILVKQAENCAKIKDELAQERKLSSKYRSLSLLLTTENQRQHELIEELKQTGDKHREMHKKDLDDASVKLGECDRQRALLKSQVKNNFIFISFEYIETMQYIYLFYESLIEHFCLKVS